MREPKSEHPSRPLFPLRRALRVPFKKRWFEGGVSRFHTLGGKGRRDLSPLIDGLPTSMERCVSKRDEAARPMGRRAGTPVESRAANGEREVGGGGGRNVLQCVQRGFELGKRRLGVGKWVLWTAKGVAGRGGRQWPAGGVRPGRSRLSLWQAALLSERAREGGGSSPG